MAKKALLMILDGWGIGKHGKGDVIYNTPTPYLDYLNAISSHSQLQASGEDVGLPDGQMGNSEVGHLNIGAGRIVYQDLVKINRACADGSISNNSQVKEAYEYAKSTGKKLHLMGLCSDGGVHSSLDHLFKLIEVGKEYGLSQQLFVHCFMDGRDTDPKSGVGFISQLTEECRKNDAAIASIVGRFYAMDRDKRWERVKEAYNLLTAGIGKNATDMVKAMEESYAEGVTDEFVKPIVNVSVNGKIEEGDVVIFINFRNDRAKELTVVLTQQEMPEQGMATIPNLKYYCMTPYDASFTGVGILFPKENVENTLGEYLSQCGKKQLHTAETEKYAHVTFFFNGGREAPYENEDRVLVVVTAPAYEPQVVQGGTHLQAVHDLIFGPQVDAHSEAANAGSVDIGLAQVNVLIRAASAAFVVVGGVLKLQALHAHVGLGLARGHHPFVALHHGLHAVNLQFGVGHAQQHLQLGSHAQVVVNLAGVAQSQLGKRCSPDTDIVEGVRLVACVFGKLEQLVGQNHTDGSTFAQLHRIVAPKAVESH